MFRGTDDDEQDSVVDMKDIGDIVSESSSESNWEIDTEVGGSTKIDNSILKITTIGKGDLRWYQALSVCSFGTFVSILLLSPAIMYTVLQSGQYVISIVPRECNVSLYQADFPGPTKDFYLETAGFTSVAAHTDWYLGEWRAYPNARGLCPIQVWVWVWSVCAVCAAIAIGVQMCSY
mgnify:CR=1 FL=1